MTRSSEFSELEEALKSIPGLGLNKEPIAFINAFGNKKGKSINVFIYPRRHEVLFPLGRCLDRSYSGLPWRLELIITDIPDKSIGYHLQSINTGNKAIKDAKVLAEELKWYMGNNTILNHFGLVEIFKEEESLDILENRNKNIKNILDN